MSSSQMVDLVSLYFIFYFLFAFYFIFLFFLFLVTIKVRVRSPDAENKVEGTRTDNVIQHGHYMLTSYSTYSHLG